MWISRVDSKCESYGVSHFVTGHSEERLAKPTVACGINTEFFNWTRNPRPKTACCLKCLEVISKNE